MSYDLSFQEIAQKTKDELVQAMRVAKADITKFRLTGNPARKKARKAIARIKTFLNSNAANAASAKSE